MSLCLLMTGTTASEQAIMEAVHGPHNSVVLSSAYTSKELPEGIDSPEQFKSFLEKYNLYIASGSDSLRNAQIQNMQSSSGVLLIGDFSNKYIQDIMCLICKNGGFYYPIPFPNAYPILRLSHTISGWLINTRCRAVAIIGESEASNPGIRDYSKELFTKVFSNYYDKLVTQKESTI